MTRDPAGLLTRIPELESLCSDPGIRRAVAKGDPFKVYRAIWWARRTGKLVAQRRTLDLLLAHRRTFAKPLSGKPTLATFNGFGATLLGKAEAEPDGTHVATHCVVALFLLPLFPLGAYVVAGGERKGVSASWSIFARVPLGAAAWLWRRAVAVAIVAAVAWTGAVALWATRHHDLTVANGLPVTVEVAVASERRRVPTGGLVTFSLPVGTHRAVAATAAGEELESLDLPVQAGRRTVLVWNVAGAAPVYEAAVEYFARAPDPSYRGPNPALHCGDRLVQASGVDDAFREPPAKVSMPKGAVRTVRRRLDVAKVDEPPADFCATALLDAHREADALRLLEARARARGWPRDDVGLLLRVALAASPAEAERVARVARGALPADVRVERAYQDVLETAGKLPELVAEYRARAEAAPDSASAQYLRLRLLDGAEQRAGAEAALARFPRDPDVVRLATLVRAETGDLPGAVDAYHALRTLSAEQAVEALHEAAASLVRLGRSAEALREIAALFDALPPSYRGEPAVLYARVAALDHAGAPDALVRRLEERGPDPLLRARAGLSAPAAGPGQELPPVPQLYALLTRDPRAALDRAKALPPVLLAVQLDAGALALLTLEAARTGAPLDGALLAFTPVRPRDLDALRRYVRGEPGAALPHVPLEVAATARFVRSRNAGLPEAERSALSAAARSEDPLALYVAEAVARWPAARR